MELPKGKRFAFSILDDTDDSTVDNSRPVYDLLHDLGFRTTKTVWAMDCPEGSRLYFAGQTLQNPAYLEFVHQLHGRGFELAWHCATMEGSKRPRTVEALEFFRGEFGDYPRLHCNHGQNRENLYWGAKRYRNPLFRQLVRFASRTADYFSGEEEDSPYFWGDLCRKHFRYVRNFTFPELNAFRYDRYMPYHMEDRPFVNYWFSTTNVPDIRRFNELLTPVRLDKLAEENGVCIISTHLGKGYVQDGRVERGASATLEHLSRLDGWFAPVSDILDYLLEHHSTGQISRLGQLAIESRHLAAHLCERLSRRRNH